MAQGRRVKVDGVMRTIPADRASRYDDAQARLSERYDGEELSAALSAVAQYLLDAPAPVTIEVGRTSADAQRAAREVLDKRKASISDLLIPLGDARRETKALAECAYVAAAAVAALCADDGLSEGDAAELAGVDRLIVRKFRGKRDRA